MPKANPIKASTLNSQSHTWIDLTFTAVRCTTTELQHCYMLKFPAHFCGCYVSNLELNACFFIWVGTGWSSGHSHHHLDLLHLLKRLLLGLEQWHGFSSLGTNSLSLSILPWTCTSYVRLLSLITSPLQCYQLQPLTCPTAPSSCFLVLVLYVIPTTINFNS